jgi:glycine betaine/proline transport system substrate-binding protein
MFALDAGAASLPGEGVSVQPLKSSIAEETFQTLLVMKALERLGYDVKPIKEIEYAAGHIAIANGDGKADLTGCTPGWGCEKVIEHHLDAYGLRDTVTHNQGAYSAIIADTIARYNQGEAVFYYTWTPYWVSGVLVPGRDVVWLQVPFSALPGERRDVDTTLPDGSNYGFQANKQRIVANRAFADAHPDAAKLFAIMRVSNNDISAQNLRMRDGEASAKDIERHADAWIRANQAKFDGWIAEAMKAAK